MSAQSTKSKFLSLEEILQTIRDNREPLARMGASRVGLFGSFARGEASESSDIDLLVEFVEGKKNYDNFIDLCFFSGGSFRPQCRSAHGSLSPPSSETTDRSGSPF